MLAERAAWVYSERMRAVVLDPPTAGLDELLERRHRSGLDRLDEVWEGVLHMVPAPSYAHASVEAQLVMILGPAASSAGLEAIGQSNLGESEHDFRVRDGALHRPGASGTGTRPPPWSSRSSPLGDESWEKLPFYAAHQVDEVLIVDPAKRSVDWLGLHNGEYRPIKRSGLIELGADELGEQIEWPAVG